MQVERNHEIALQIAKVAARIHDDDAASARMASAVSVTLLNAFIVSAPRALLVAP